MLAETAFGSPGTFNALDPRSAPYLPKAIPCPPAAHAASILRRTKWPKTRRENPQYQQNNQGAKRSGLAGNEIEDDSNHISCTGDRTDSPPNFRSQISRHRRTGSPPQWRRGGAFAPGWSIPAALFAASAARFESFAGGGLALPLARFALFVGERLAVPYHDDCLQSSRVGQALPLRNPPHSAAKSQLIFPEHHPRP